MPIQKFTPKNNIDVVICVDGTASMRPIIDNVKAEILSFCPKYVDSMEEIDMTIDQFRIKVIIFRDYGYDEQPMAESEFFILPEQIESFTAFVNSIEAKGGGDSPKNALEAIAFAMKSKWTNLDGMTYGKSRHIILVFTNSEALPLGEYAFNAQYPSGIPTNLAELGKWWEEGVPGSNYRPKKGRLIVFAPNTYPWNDDMLSWNRYYPTFFQAEQELLDTNLESAIKIMICGY